MWNSTLQAEFSLLHGFSLYKVVCVACLSRTNVGGLFTCKETAAHRVVKFYCHSWSPITEDLHENSCETPCEVYVKIMCELLACEILDVLPFNED